MKHENENTKLFPDLWHVVTSICIAYSFECRSNHENPGNETFSVHCMNNFIKFIRKKLQRISGHLRHTNSIACTSKSIHLI